jgi:RNA recognition motif-containing protein
MVTQGFKVYIGGLPNDAEQRDLRDFFRKFDKSLNDAWVARKPPGFGFVWFDDLRDAVQ